MVDHRDRMRPIGETTTIKDMLLSHPRALRVLLDLGVPSSCAQGTVADAARACSLAPTVFLAELQAGLTGSGSAAVRGQAAAARPAEALLGMRSGTVGAMRRYSVDRLELEQAFRETTRRTATVVLLRFDGLVEGATDASTATR